MNLNLPNVVLRSAFRTQLSDSTSQLNICHINGGSIVSKMDQIRNILLNTDTHILAVGETWLKSYHPAKDFKIDSFKLYRNDRELRSCGGVCIFIKDHLRCRIVAESESSGPNKTGTEFLFLEVVCPTKKILFGVVYKAPDVDELDVVTDLLSRLAPQFNEIIVTGDFNEDILKNNTRTQRFCGIIHQHSMSILNTTCATHFPPNTSPTLLDLFLVSSPCNVLRCSQVNAPGISRHDFIFISYKFQVHGNKVKCKRHLNNINVNSLLEDASALPWSDLLQIADVNETFDKLTNMIFGLLDDHAPLRTQKVTKIGQPWFSNVVYKALIERDIAYRCWIRYKTEESHRSFKILRNKAVLEIRRAKYRYCLPRLDWRLGSRNIWRNLRALNVVASRDSAPPPFTCEEFNQHLLNNSPTSFDRSLPEQPPSSSHNADTTLFKFHQITEDEFVNAIHMVKSDAVGLDNIPLSFIKLLLPVVGEIITKIFNKGICTSTFPDIWKSAKVLPVAKSFRSKTCAEYRPISILPSLSKVFEIILKNQIMDHINKNSLLFENQSGFRTDHSAQTAVLQVTQLIRQAFEQHKISVLILLDFSKAFDTVHHNILCSKLTTQFNFSQSAVKLIKSYLSDRLQSVWIDEVCSTPLPVTAGVPQGSVLGPILFSLFINDLPKVLRMSQCHLYADDVQLLAHRDPKDLVEFIGDFNLELAAVSEWAKLNHLTLNASKTQAILLTNNPKLDLAIPNVILDGKSVPFADSVTDLGFTLTRNLSWNEDATNVAAKIFGGLRSLWSHQRNLPLKTRVNLVKTLLMPHFCYGSVVYAKLSVAAEKTLQRAFNACIRFVSGLRRYEGTSEHQNVILGCGLHQYMEYRTCLFMFKLLQSGQPDYLLRHLKRGMSSRTGNIVIPFHKTSNMGSSFFVHGVSVWNSLPLDIRDRRSIWSFKTACRNHFLIS